jgi:hypothetical protein
LSTHALMASGAPAAPRLVRWLDLAVLALALPVFLAAGLPLLGWGAVAAVWLLQRAVHDLLSRRAAAAADPRHSTVLLAVSMMGRVWLLALAIFAAGMAEREAGLSAAVLSIALVTAYLVGVMTGSPFRPTATSVNR